MKLNIQLILMGQWDSPGATIDHIHLTWSTNKFVTNITRICGTRLTLVVRPASSNPVALPALGQVRRRRRWRRRWRRGGSPATTEVHVGEDAELKPSGAERFPSGRNGLRLLGRVVESRQMPILISMSRQQ